MKKYAKFIVCMGLILGIMAPSYAALSASDGSAFVTKAEFDSALADFNARLTTFEAGINSKIDSQVTSYLDRNGIWSGKDQDLLWTRTVLGDDAHKDWAYAMRASWNSSKIVGKDMNFWKYPLVNKINKSGLLYALVSLGVDDGYITTLKMVNIRIARAEGSTNAWEYTVNIGWGLMVTRGTSDVLLSATSLRSFAGRQSSESATYFDTSFVGPMLGSSVALIFVNSDDKLHFVTWAQAATGHSAVTFQGFDLYPFPHQCKIDSLKVY